MTLQRGFPRALRWSIPTFQIWSKRCSEGDDEQQAAHINNQLNDDALNTFLRQQGLKIEDLVDLINFETRSNTFDQLFFDKNYPNQIQLNLKTICIFS